MPESTNHNASVNPASIRRARTMAARISRADAEARYLRQRRQAARAAGYRGPLTRDEASRRTLAALAGSR